MKTPKKLLNNNKAYRRTKGGVIRNIFSHIKERGGKYNRVVEFNSNELYEWMMNRPEFHIIFSEWVSDGFKRRNKPSIDRKDPLKDYLYSNIQITTYQFNRDKGDAEKEILCGKPIMQLDMNGNEINRFQSIKEAANKLKLNKGLISFVLTGKRNHTGGFRFIYETPSLLNQLKQRT